MQMTTILSYFYFSLVSHVNRFNLHEYEIKSVLLIGRKYLLAHMLMTIVFKVLAPIKENILTIIKTVKSTVKKMCSPDMFMTFGLP